MAVTIKDVAKLAMVSTSTVSRVCNNNPAISRETQERVRAAMAELGYVPLYAVYGCDPADHTLSPWERILGFLGR